MFCFSTCHVEKVPLIIESPVYVTNSPSVCSSPVLARILSGRAVICRIAMPSLSAPLWPTSFLIQSYVHKTEEACGSKRGRVWNFVRSALSRTGGANSTFWAPSWGAHSSLHFDTRLYKYSTHVVIHWLISFFGYGTEIYLCAEVFIEWNFSHWQHRKLSCEQFPRGRVKVGNIAHMVWIAHFLFTDSAYIAHAFQCINHIVLSDKCQCYEYPWCYKSPEDDNPIYRLVRRTIDCFSWRS